MVQVRAIDKLDKTGSNNYLDEIPIRMIPVFDWSREDFAVNVPMYAKNGIYVPSYVNDYGEYGDFIEAVRTKLDGEGGIGIGGIEYDTEILGNNINFWASGGIYLNQLYPITDYVIAQGDDGSYAYRKWASGVMEAWRSSTSTVTGTASTAHGAFYYADGFSLATTGSASQFTAIDSVQLTVNKNNSTGIYIPVVKSTGISSKKVTVNYLVGAAVSGSISFIPHVHIIGRWK